MVYHHRYNQLMRKSEAIDEESQAILVMDCSKYSGLYKRTKPKLVSLILLSLLSFTFVLTPHIFGCDSAFSLLCKPLSLIALAFFFIPFLCLSFPVLYHLFFFFSGFLQSHLNMKAVHFLHLILVLLFLMVSYLYYFFFNIQYILL